MPNKFEGQVQDNFDRKLKDVKVTLTGPGIPPSTFTKTDENGKWMILLKQSIESKDVTVTFTKSGMESKQVTNPQPTEVLNGFIDPEKGGTLDLQGLYESGTYLVSSLSNESKEILDQELEDLFQFIKLHPGNTKITITSSESQVTNSDNEKGDGIDRTNEFRKTPGSLAKARAEALQKYVNTFLDKKYTENPNLDLKLKPIIEFGDITRVGLEPWERFYAPDPKNPNNLIQIENSKVIADNQRLLDQYNLGVIDPEAKLKRTADLPKYKNDQYTRITVEVINIPSIPDCLAGNLVIDIMYLNPLLHSTSNNLPGGVSHNCNNALFLLEAKGGNIDPNIRSNLDNGIILKRDDGVNYASLNNKIGVNGKSVSAYNEQYVNPTLFNNGETVSEKFQKEVKQYDNSFTGYQSIDKIGSDNLNDRLRRASANRSDPSGRIAFNNLMGRFKPLKPGDIFPIDPSTGSNDKPLTNVTAGERYNRFIINSNLLKTITGDIPDKIITFSLRCVNSSTGIDEYTGLNTGKTDWYSNFENKNGGWKNGCHKGVGTFNLYKIKLGTGSNSNKMIVEATTGFLNGKTPPDKNQLLWLFQYDVCKNEIIKSNDLVFKNLNEITSEED